jgi:serine/threonine-protein kinase
MSPEQASGEPLDGRSDVYSLGAVAYFATTGRAPIDGTSSMAILAKQVSETPPSLAAARRDLPPRFVAAVDRCLAKDRAARWPSAEALAHALRSIGGNTLEIAAPVRAFLRDADAAGNELSTAVTVGTTSMLMLAITLMQSSATFAAGLSRAFGVMLYVGTAASMTGLAGWRVWQLVDRARAFMRAGYRHSAIKPALDLEAARIEEESSPMPSSLKSTLVRVIAGVGATAASLWLAGTGIDAIELIGIGGSILAPTLTIRHLVSRAQGGRSWWNRLLRGAFGKAVFRAASVGLGAAPEVPAIGEPTSVALGSAVEALFNALPDAQRQRFAEVPGLVAKLERSAMELRRRTPGPDLDERSTIVVAALESLRLDLLRLHAATASPGDLTRDLEAAERIGDEIAAQLAARESVERIVRGGLSPSAGDAATPAD